VSKGKVTPLTFFAKWGVGVGQRENGNDKNRKIVEFTFADIFALIYKITQAIEAITK